MSGKAVSNQVEVENSEPPVGIVQENNVFSSVLSMDSNETIVSNETVATDDSLCAQETLCTTLSLPFKAEEKSYGVWFIQRDFITDGEIDSFDSIFEIFCVKVDNKSIIGQTSSNTFNNNPNLLMTGKIKNGQNKIALTFSSDEWGEFGKQSKLSINYSEQEPHWFGEWRIGDTVQGDVSAILRLESDQYFVDFNCGYQLGN